MATPKATPVKVNELVCHAMQVAVSAVLQDYARRYPAGRGLAQNAKLELEERDLYGVGNSANQLVASLFSWVLAPLHPERDYLTFEYKVPTTWFDHLKQSIKYGARPRWINYRLWAWFIQKLQVKLTLKTQTKDYVKTYYVCPHADVEFNDPRHILFVTHGPLEGGYPV